MPRAENRTVAGTASKPNRSVRVGRSHTGKGVFGRRYYRADEVIGEIVGRLIHDADYGSDYCFFIGDDLFLEPESPFRFINHSCDPNCEFDWYDLTEQDETKSRRRVFLWASADIKPGEELTIDYNWSAAAAIRCRCQSDFCRGWIVSADELRSVEADHQFVRSP